MDWREALTLLVSRVRPTMILLAAIQVHILIALGHDGLVAIVSTGSNMEALATVFSPTLALVAFSKKLSGD